MLLAIEHKKRTKEQTTKQKLLQSKNWSNIFFGRLRIIFSLQESNACYLYCQLCRSNVAYHKMEWQHVKVFVTEIQGIKEL